MAVYGVLLEPTLFEERLIYGFFCFDKSIWDLIRYWYLMVGGGVCVCGDGWMTMDGGVCVCVVGW